MNRQAAIPLTIKAVSEEKRQIEGWATRIEEDRMGDIVVPDGVKYELPIPFLLDHDHEKAVGQVDKIEVTKKGIKFWAHIKKITEDGELKQLTDYAWSLIKNGLRSSVSIGFRPLDAEQIPNSYGIKFNSWEWLELSGVTVPAHQGAKITGIKSLDGIDKLHSYCPEEHPGTIKLVAPKPKADFVKLSQPER